MKYFILTLMVPLLIIVNGCNNTKTLDISNLQEVKTLELKNQDGVIFHGVIKSKRIADLSFQSEGKIIYLPYSRGDFVKKGQVLARLDGVLYKIRKNEELARLKEAQIRQAKAKNYYQRMDILHKAGAISDNDWDDAYFGLKTVNQEILIQKEKLDYLDKEISYNIITAPYDGYIAEKYSEVGSYTALGQKVLTIMSTIKTQAEIIVDSSIINSLKLNDKVVAKRNNKTYDAKISSISRTSLFNGGFLVSIIFDDLYDELKDGMSVDILISSENKNLAYVPIDCIFEQDGKKFIYKITKINQNIGEVKKEKIETGAIVNDEIEVFNGLNKGDIIIDDDFSKIYPNMKVKIWQKNF